MTEASEGGWSRPGEADERRHKDRAMERVTEERRGEEREHSSIIHHAALWLWEGVIRAEEGSFKRLKPNWATELRIKRSGTELIDCRRSGVYLQVYL